MTNRPRIRIHELVGRLWHHIGGRRRSQFVFVMALTLAGTIAEVVSLGAVLPFLSVLIFPEKLSEYPFFIYILSICNSCSSTQLVWPLTLSFVIVALLAGALRLLQLWANTKFAFACGADLSNEVYSRTLYQPYSVHLVRNSSEVVSGIIHKANGVVFWVIQPMLTLISSGILLFAILLALILIDPFVAVVTIGGFGASYGGIMMILRPRLRLNGDRINHEQTQLIKVIEEGLGGIRDVLLDGTQSVFCELYKRADLTLRQSYSNNIFIGGSPRFVMEALGIALIAFVALALSQNPEGLAPSLPILGALALGAQRLLPALQQSYSAWVSIIGGYAPLADTIEILDQPVPVPMYQSPPSALLFEQCIQFDAVRFRYSGVGSWVLDGLDLKIEKGERIGIVGQTGSGKSTLVDLLMCLLSPTEGMLLVDGMPCTGNRIRAWQKTIAHVPQDIYLTDSTWAENIAFGISRDAIDLDRVKFAARQAQIADFIESRPDGYQGKIGERGIRLSGGQRQRIGIARALYKQAKVLVFDEATSALDGATELSVMNTIDGLANDLTIVLIAHRLSTLRLCGRIIELENGLLKRQGTYNEMIELIAEKNI